MEKQNVTQQTLKTSLESDTHVLFIVNQLEQVIDPYSIIEYQHTAEFLKGTDMEIFTLPH